MNKIVIAVGLLMAAAALPSLAGTPCDTVKAEIAKKIDRHGVKAYTLETVVAADAKDQKVVGSCEGGTKKIVYARGAAKAAAPAPAAAAPQ